MAELVRVDEKDPRASMLSTKRQTRKTLADIKDNDHGTPPNEPPHGTEDTREAGME